jgi:REP element-mobilizing transposase RayT
MLGIKNVRLPEYDYRSDGYYFVTINTRSRFNLCEDHELTVEQIFRETCAALHGVTIDTMIVMPNHVHLLYCLENSSHELGEIVRRCKAKTSYVYNERFWQPNYHEHIVRNEGELNRIRAYILMNPELTIWREGVRQKWKLVNQRGTGVG